MNLTVRTASRSASTRTAVIRRQINDVNYSAAAHVILAYQYARNVTMPSTLLKYRCTVRIVKKSVPSVTILSRKEVATFSVYNAND